MNAMGIRLIGGMILVSLAVVGASRTATGQSETQASGDSASAYATKGPGSSAQYASSELEQGTWASGGSLGFLGGTPDKTAFALNGNVEYFVADNVSVGPLVQLGVTDDMAQVGVSAQGKYWIPLAGTNGRGKIALQSGLGFVHSDFLRSDTSWLVPVGVGYEHTLDSGMSMTATTLVNFTNLHTGFGTGADVMPGVAFGLRF
ncbi:MAG: hypothetical protein HY599_01635 [Candidatus Omnitrophica bacterium]|nr:hypothetical protein [Candidatus Omnitrophota bacterium]